MNTQHRNTFDETEPFEYSEGQQSVLCCNGASIRCPSLDLSFKQAKERLLKRGMSQKDFESLVGFLRGLAIGFIEEELRRINNHRQDKGYEN